MSTATVGLRERKKDATRQALHTAAVRLAAERGLEAVTVEAIADAAMVSRRTFSNYFASKEDAILHRDSARTRRLLELVERRPADEPPWSALSRAAEELVGEDQLDPDRHAQLRLLRSHPVLLARQVAIYGGVERALADLLRGRSPGLGDLPARLMAATLVTAVRVAVQVWSEEPETPLPAVLHEALQSIGDRWE